MVIGAFIGVANTAVAEELAFTQPVTCSLVGRGETVTAEFTPNNKNSGGYWSTIVDSWYGNNFGDEGTYFGVGPVHDLRAAQPEGNGFMVWGVAEPGEPITNLSVSVWASRRDFHIGGDGYEKFNELVKRTILREQYPYYNLYAGKAQNGTYRTFGEEGLPDPLFTAAELYANGGRLEFDAPLISADGNIENDKIVCVSGTGR